MMTRRSLLGFIAAAPFIVKASSLMPVRAFAAEVAPTLPPAGWFVISGIDQYGCQQSEAFRCGAHGTGGTTIRWQQIEQIYSVDGSFAKRMPT